MNKLKLRQIRLLTIGIFTLFFLSIYGASAVAAEDIPVENVAQFIRKSVLSYNRAETPSAHDLDFLSSLNKTLNQNLPRFSRREVLHMWFVYVVELQKAREIQDKYKSYLDAMAIAVRQEKEARNEWEKRKFYRERIQIRERIFLEGGDRLSHALDTVDDVQRILEETIVPHFKRAWSQQKQLMTSMRLSIQAHAGKTPPPDFDSVFSIVSAQPGSTAASEYELIAREVRELARYIFATYTGFQDDMTVNLLSLLIQEINEQTVRLNQRSSKSKLEAAGGKNIFQEKMEVVSKIKSSLDKLSADIEASDENLTGLRAPWKEKVTSRLLEQIQASQVPEQTKTVLVNLIRQIDFGQFGIQSLANYRTGRSSMGDLAAVRTFGLLFAMIDSGALPQIPPDSLAELIVSIAYAQLLSDFYDVAVPEQKIIERRKNIETALQNLRKSAIQDRFVEIAADFEKLDLKAIRSMDGRKRYHSLPTILLGQVFKSFEGAYSINYSDLDSLLANWHQKQLVEVNKNQSKSNIGGPGSLDKSGAPSCRSFFNSRRL